MKAGLGNLVALIVLTIGSAIVMVTVSAGTNWFGFLPNQAQQKVLDIPRMPVSAYRVSPETLDIVTSFTGMIRPFERYTLGFEVGGRLENFGVNGQNKPLDQGDLVTKGQVLAKLDDRLLIAQLKDSKARLEQAQTNLNRANELRSRGERLVTDAEYQDKVTQLQLAQAAVTIAERRLEDTVLISPTDGKISRRLVNAGESVNANQAVFELVEVDRVLLVVGVPESQINDISVGQPAKIELLARDKFGQKLPGFEGQVYRVGETADDKTGLFEVEIAIDNSSGKLRPGLVALGHIATEQLQGYRLPMSSVVFREGSTVLFSVGEDRCAHSYPLEKWIEQGRDVIIPEIPDEHRMVVIRGQHRLIDGRTVDVTELTESDLSTLQADVSQPNAAVGSHP